MMRPVWNDLFYLFIYFFIFLFISLISLFNNLIWWWCYLCPFSQLRGVDDGSVDDGSVDDGDDDDEGDY